MTTGTRLNTISTKHKIQVDFDVNHVFSWPATNVTWNSTGEYTFEGTPMTQTLDERLMWLGARWENGMKTEWAEWHIKDESRGTVWYEDLVCTMENMYSDFWNAYNVTYKCKIVNASVRLILQLDTSLEVGSQEFDAWVQAQADQAAADWFTMRSATPITE